MRFIPTNMKATRVLIPLITFLFLSISFVKSQVVADFTMNIQAGCSPLDVRFISLNEPADSFNYMWYLGVQQGTSTLKEPRATYTTPGAYDVKLVVQKGIEKDSVTKTILVFKNPKARFTSERMGCTPFEVQFTDLSVQGDGQIVKWYWDFRTGDTLTARNPLKTFLFPGQYDIYYEVTDVHGCKDFVDSLKYIDVVNPPVANFSISPASACQVPALFSFTNQSVVQGSVTYNWDFGDGTQSQQVNPSKTYNTFSNYPVKLTVTSDHGCSDDTVKTAFVSAVTAAGTIRQFEKPVTMNDTICLGMIDFSNASTGTDNVRWFFGDGTSTASKFGFHQYTVAKTYEVLLVASPGTVCADTLKWNLMVEDIKADFNMSVEYSCSSPVNVNFTDASANTVKWEWSFYDNTKVLTQNTSKIFTLPYDADPYLINTDVPFVTMLTVESPGGCKASKVKTLVIKKPTAMFTVDKVEGCIPLKVKFKDKSIKDKPEHNIISYEWIFGNSVTSSGIVDSVIYDYNSDGFFPSRLVITNNVGCKDTSYIIPINAGKKLLPDFTVNPADACQNTEITFSDNTPESGLIQRWRYQVGGTDINNIPDDPNPKWIMHADTGYLDVKLEVFYNGCLSDTVKQNVLYNKGPFARFNFDFNCSSPYDYSFTNLSKGLESFQWKFGDGDQNTTDLNPTHTYAAEGNYLAELIVNKETCTDTYMKTILVRNPKAVISGKNSGCVGQPLLLSGIGSYNMVDYCHEKYLWDFGDSTSKILTIQDNIEHIYSDRGQYTIKLKTEFDNGCTDSSTHNIDVFKPYVGFSADTLFGCSPFIVNFSDTSKADVHPIAEWKWTFEPGTDSTYYSQIPKISHWFNNPGIFNVSLVVTDTLGCEGDATATVSTANPDARFSVANPYVCLGNEVRFIYTQQDIDSLIWSFGDGAFSRNSVPPVNYAYQDSGSFIPNLVIYRFGCSDSFTRPEPILVQMADARYEVSDSFWNCYPHEITFNHNIHGQTIVSGIWNFGYGNTPPAEYSNLKVFTYPKPGKYSTSLNILTSFGCRDTAIRTIEITGPTGGFALSENYACKGDEVRFDTLFTNDVFDYEWDMGDGSPFLRGSPVIHIYGAVGPFYPKLILYGDSGRCKPPPVVDTILIAEVIASFEVPDTGLCNTYEITLTNNSVGNLTNNWNINNNIFTSEINPAFTLQEGPYMVTLFISNAIGCKDTFTQNFIAHPLPLVQMMHDTLICAGDKITIWVSGGDLVAWSPAAGLSSTTSYTPDASPLTTTLYTAVTKYAETGCRSMDEIWIYVQRAPAFSVLPENTTVVIGEIIKVRIDSLDDFTYLWTSSPLDGLMSCITCASPSLRPLENTIYTLMVADTNNCFTENYYIYVVVDEKYSLDVPDAFKPTGEPENAIVYAKGWGIMRLLEFRIYNRYGNEVFYTNDINQGWDGTYKGKLQNIDSYAYTVTAEMWDGQIKTKKGTITLLR